jgi:hypothetical protein
MSDTDEFDHGTDPTQGILPLTEENAFKPWERLGISEDEWHDLEKAILDQINPGGWKSFLFGDAAESIVLDENGELVLIPPGALYAYKDGKLEVYPLQENGVGGGLVKGLAKILGAAARAPPAALKERAGEAAGQPPPPARELRPPQGRRGRGPDREGPAALPAGRWLPPLREARRRVRLPDAGRVPQGRPRPDRARGHRDLHAHQRRQALLRRRAQRVRGQRPDGILRTYFKPKDGWTTG